VAAQAGAQPVTTDSAGVAAALNAFLRAFENLDWERFRTSFTDDATVFFPSAGTPDQFEGRAAIEARFRKEFTTIRNEAHGGPPYMQLAPLGLYIEILDGGTALVTFSLHNRVRFARRTLILVRQPTGWRIRHLHASNVPWPDQPAR
jgi:ketosteroid isomerase-like protein